jgi:hypothetical protein
MRTFACFWRVSFPLCISLSPPISCSCRAIQQLDTHSVQLNKRKEGICELLVCEATDKTAIFCIRCLILLLGTFLLWFRASYSTERNCCHVVHVLYCLNDLVLEMVADESLTHLLRHNVLYIAVSKVRKEQDNFYILNENTRFSRNRFPFVCIIFVERILCIFCLPVLLLWMMLDV